MKATSKGSYREGNCIEGRQGLSAWLRGGLDEPRRGFGLDKNGKGLLKRLSFSQ